MSTVSPLDTVLRAAGLSEVQVAVLTGALQAREDAALDALRVVAVQWGVMPEITAEVLAELGLGSPIDDATRAVIHNQFHLRIEQIRRDQNPGNN